MTNSVLKVAFFSQVTQETAKDSIELVLSDILPSMKAFPDKMKEIDQEVRTQIGELLGVTSSDAMNSLVKRLHENCTHPDYEYKTVETGRKSGADTTPNGFGWEENVDRDFTRDDYTEYHHYRRLKTYAAQDIVRFFDAPMLRMPQLNLLEYLSVVFKKFAPYIKENTITQIGDVFEYKVPPDVLEKRSKAFTNEIKSSTFVSRLAQMYGLQEILHEYHRHSSVETIPPTITRFKEHVIPLVDVMAQGINVFTYKPENENDAAIELQKEVPGLMQLRSDEYYFFVESGDFQFLTACRDPFASNFIRTKNKGGVWSVWDHWSYFPGVNINKYELFEKINSLV